MTADQARRVIAWVDPFGMCPVVARRTKHGVSIGPEPRTKHARGPSRVPRRPFVGRRAGPYRTPAKPTGGDMHGDEIELGDLARDTITGFTGVVICIDQWLHGCSRVVLQPKELHEGSPVKPHTFDLPQLEIVAKRQHGGTGDTGGPRPTPSKPSKPA